MVHSAANAMKIMQCWDDGVINDAPLAELLRKYGAKATFNINPGLNDRSTRKLGCWEHKGFAVGRLSLDEMKDVYRGQTVGGHTMTHPHLPRIDPERRRAELVDCKAFIREFFGQERCGFAYPFGTYDDASKQAVRDAGYLYARTTRNVDGALPLSDPMALHSHCHFLNEAFWTKYEAVRQTDGIFYFWGHSYELKDDRALWDAFEAKLARIAADKQAEWIHIADLF
jgi:peptidoglycan/xylan/chitin deacetylase (PgdA/CDA1 family)